MIRRSVAFGIDRAMDLSTCVLCLLLIGRLWRVDCRLPDVTPATPRLQEGQVRCMLGEQGTHGGAGPELVVFSTNTETRK